MKFCAVGTLSKVNLKALSLLAGCSHASERRRNQGMVRGSTLLSALTSGVSLIPHFCFVWKIFRTSYSVETELLDHYLLFKCSSLAFLFHFCSAERVPALNLEGCVYVCVYIRVWVLTCGYI